MAKQVIKKSKLHYNLVNEIESFIKKGCCSYWKNEPYSKFMKPCVYVNDDKWMFKNTHNSNKIFKLMEGVLNKTTKLKLFFNVDENLYIYQHYENKIKKIEYKTTNYMDIHTTIIREINNYKNIVLNY